MAKKKQDKPTAPEEPVVKQTKARKATPAEDQAKSKKASALDAAARVLAEEARPMNCQELIATMAAKGYWTSPGGQTPHATLYSAILSEMSKKGEAARFQKVERGKFALRNG